MLVCRERVSEVVHESDGNEVRGKEMKVRSAWREPCPNQGAATSRVGDCDDHSEGDRELLEDRKEGSVKESDAPLDCREKLQRTKVPSHSFCSM